MKNMGCKTEYNDEKQAEPKPSQEKLTIPKHRFDCVNLCLRETKQRLRDKTAEADAHRILIAEMKKALIDAKVETALTRHCTKNLTATKALINYLSLKLEQDGSVPGLEEQILDIKESQSYLFDNDENTAYVLVPVKSGDGLHKSITDYIENRRM